MVLVLLMLVAFSVMAILLGRSVPRGRWFALIGATIIVFLTILIAWWFVLYFQLVPIYRALPGLGIYRTEGALGALIFFGPPLVATLVLVIVASHWKRGAQGDRGK